MSSSLFLSALTKGLVSSNERTWHTLKCRHGGLIVGRSARPMMQFFNGAWTAIRAYIRLFIWHCGSCSAPICQQLRIRRLLSSFRRRCLFCHFRSHTLTEGTGDMYHLMPRSTTLESRETRPTTEHAKPRQRRLVAVPVFHPSALL